MTEPTQKPVVHKEAGVAGEPCELNGSTVDQIASAFQDGFTNGNMSWKETPEYHKDMYREGVRCVLAAISPSRPVAASPTLIKIDGLHNVIADRDREIAELREALQKIADHPENFHSKDQAYGVGWAFFNVQAIARAALQRDAQGGDTHADHR